MDKSKTYVEHAPSPDELRPLDGYDGQLQHHCEEPVAAQLLRNTSHHQFMRDGADQEGNKHGDRA